MLTAGDPAVVTSLCNEAWQGEISTILPLSQIDRRTILETANSWKLGDLDVAAFSYSPVPHTVEQRLRKNGNLKSQVGCFALPSVYCYLSNIFGFCFADVSSRPR